jgi:hypothetical protein
MAMRGQIAEVTWEFDAAQGLPSLLYHLRVSSCPISIARIQKWLKNQATVAKADPGHFGGFSPLVACSSQQGMVEETRRLSGLPVSETLAFR